MDCPHAFVYEHCDVPPGVTLAEWRRPAAGARRRPRGLAAVLTRLARPGRPGRRPGA